MSASGPSVAAALPACPFTGQPAVPAVGDACDLAKSLSSDFSPMPVTGVTPPGHPPSVPSLDRIGSSLGGKPKYAACEASGLDPSVAVMVAGGIGLAPEWTDKAGEPASR